MRQPGKANPRGRRDLRDALLFLAPSFVGFLAFVAFPLGFSLIMAFTNWDLARREPLGFVGFENFRSLLWGENSLAFWKYFLNTVYLLIGLPFSIAGSLAIALLLNRPPRLGNLPSARYVVGAIALGLGIAGAGLLWSAGYRDAAFGLVLLAAVAALGAWLGTVFFRTLFYLPQFTAGVALYILWKNLFSPGSGLINQVLRVLAPDVAAPQWLTSLKNLWGLNPEAITPSLQFFGLGARDALILMGVWIGIGGANCLMYLAGLTTIPDDLYEAAEIDGAGRWATFRHVTWPHLAPTTFFIVIISIIGGLQGGFEQARVMTAGGPAGTTTTLGYYIYTVGFEQFRLGLASAVAWIMFVVIFAMTLVHWRYGNRFVDM